MILAGQLNRVITIQRVTVTRESKYQSSVKEWNDLLIGVRAQVVQKRGDEKLSNTDTEVSTEDAIFRIRYPKLPVGSTPSVLMASDRIVYDGYYWELLPFRELGGSGEKKRILEIPAKRTQGVA